MQTEVRVGLAILALGDKFWRGQPYMQVVITFGLMQKELN